jgi:hypothetical protein
MIQVLSLLPCSRALIGPNGFHVKGGSFVRNIYEPVKHSIDFVVCLKVEFEPPPDVAIEIFDPWTQDIYHGFNDRELPHYSPIYEVRVRVADVILRETGEHAFRLLLNGEAVFTGPLWGFLK